MDAGRITQLYARLGADYDFQNWLRETEAGELKILVKQLDPALIHRTQGRIGIVQDLLAQTSSLAVAPPGRLSSVAGRALT